MITRRQVLKGMLGTAALAALPLRAFAQEQAVAPPSPTAPVDQEDVYRFTERLCRLAESSINERSIARKCLLVDRLNCGELPRYSFDWSLGESPLTLWREGTSYVRETITPFDVPGDRRPVGLCIPFEESLILHVPWERCRDSRLLKDSAHKLTDYYVAKEADHLLRLLDGCYQRVLHPAVGEGASPDDLISDGFGIIETREEVVYNVLCNEDGLKMLKRSRFYDESGGNSYVLTADVHVLKHPALEGRAFLLPHPEIAGVIALRQQLTLLHTWQRGYVEPDTWNDRCVEPELVTYYEPAYGLQPAHCVMLEWKT
jgi:hypothetical protein